MKRFAAKLLCMLLALALTLALWVAAILALPDRMQGTIAATMHTKADLLQDTAGQPRIIFAGTFCAKSRVRFDGGRVTVVEQGTIHKFVRRVQQITFSGPRAAARHKYVVFITERGVFRLEEDGLVLTEIAPGIDLERDILANMDYAPRIAEDLRLMPQELFNEGPMGLEALWAAQAARQEGQ